MPVIVLLADGARVDTVDAAMCAGKLPTLARLRDEGSMQAVTSVFPSVTGPAYAPFLMGRFPGPVGLPGLRWYDRTRTRCARPGYSRSYVGPELRHVDADLDPEAPTIYELLASGPPASRPRTLGAFNVIGRGLPLKDRVAYGWRYVPRLAWVHFRGDVGGWARIDREIAHRAARFIREHRPEFSFIALPGVDKISHATGHDASGVTDSLRVVDNAAAEIRADAEHAGTWERTHLWIASDHGHSPVRWQDDLATAIRAAGHDTMAHPWVFRRARDVAVMVSGNAMAHVYLELERCARPWWPELARRWEPLAEMLLERPAVDLILLPHTLARCEVRGRGRGHAIVERLGDRYSYRPITGDPLGLGEREPLDSDEAHAITMGSEYPDGIVQIAHLAGAPRSGEIIVSAARDWDLRARYEPIPHRSSHGALHREHMLVPLILNRSPARAPRRTTDVMPSALTALGVSVPDGLDGSSFL